MTCEQFETLLEALLDRRIADSERRALAHHASGCPRCRELEGLTTGVRLAGDEPGPELTRSILGRTAGDPCERAALLLPDRVDDRLESAIDLELLAGHLEHCTDCAALQRALVGLREGLPWLARLDPGEPFTRAVLARTSGAVVEPGWRERLAATLQRWSRRPRFAWESAYVVTALVMVVTAIQGPALRADPETIRDLAALTRPARTADGTPVWSARFNTLGRKAWPATGGEGLQQLESVRGTLEDRYRRTSEARAAFKKHGSELADAVNGMNVKRGTSALRQLGGELGVIVRQLLGESREDSGAVTQDSNGSNETP